MDQAPDIGGDEGRIQGTTLNPAAGRDITDCPQNNRISVFRYVDHASFILFLIM
jgi:hypothetical protein